MNTLNHDLMKRAEEACGCSVLMVKDTDPPEERVKIRAEKAREEAKGRSHLILGEKVAAMEVGGPMPMTIAPNPLDDAKNAMKTLTQQAGGSKPKPMLSGMGAGGPGGMAPKAGPLGSGFGGAAGGAGFGGTKPKAVAGTTKGTMMAGGGDVGQVKTSNVLDLIDKAAGCGRKSKKKKKVKVRMAKVAGTPLGQVPIPPTPPLGYDRAGFTTSPDAGAQKLFGEILGGGAAPNVRDARRLSQHERGQFSGFVNATAPALAVGSTSLAGTGGGGASTLQAGGARNAAVKKWNTANPNAPAWQRSLMGTVEGGVGPLGNTSRGTAGGWVRQMGAADLPFRQSGKRFSAKFGQNDVIDALVGITKHAAKFGQNDVIDALVGITKHAAPLDPDIPSTGAQRSGAMQNDMLQQALKPNFAPKADPMSDTSAFSEMEDLVDPTATDPSLGAPGVADSPGLWNETPAPAESAPTATRGQGPKPQKPGYAAEAGKMYGGLASSLFGEGAKKTWDDRFAKQKPEQSMAGATQQTRDLLKREGEANVFSGNVPPESQAALTKARSGSRPERRAAGLSQFGPGGTDIDEGEMVGTPDVGQTPHSFRPGESFAGAPTPRTTPWPAEAGDAPHVTEPLGDPGGLVSPSARAQATETAGDVPARSAGRPGEATMPDEEIAKDYQPPEGGRFRTQIARAERAGNQREVQRLRNMEEEGNIRSRDITDRQRAGEAVQPHEQNFQARMDLYRQGGDPNAFNMDQSLAARDLGRENIDERLATARGTAGLTPGQTPQMLAAAQQRQRYGGGPATQLPSEGSQEAQPSAEGLVGAPAAGMPQATLAPKPAPPAGPPVDNLPVNPARRRAALNSAGGQGQTASVHQVGANTPAAPAPGAAYDSLFAGGADPLVTPPTPAAPTATPTMAPPAAVTPPKKPAIKKPLTL